MEDVRERQLAADLLGRSFSSSVLQYEGAGVMRSSELP